MSLLGSHISTQASKCVACISLVMSLMLTSNALASSAEVSVLFDTINERLSYMESVASYKAVNRLPIEDVKREDVVLQKAVESALLHGLEAKSVQYFYEVQIRVAKAIQYRHRAYLLHIQEPIKADDLISAIRPKLIALSTRLNEVLGQVIAGGGVTEHDRKAFRQRVNHQQMSETDYDMIFNALLEIRAELPQ